jgi:hypothetical protein
MSYGLKLLVPCALALYLASACQPDLDSLSATYSPNAGTSGSSSDGGMSNSGGATSTCENMVKDATESDVDCGGSGKCDRCAEKARCTTNSDCLTPLYCTLTSTGKRCTEPTCDDQIQNGDETGEDCGGSCDACDLGAACEDNNDCTGNYCLESVCADHCISGVKEADETAKDCGGESCPKCANGLACEGADDCESGVCFNQKCQAASCNDSIKNQDESFEDCGGVCSAAGKPCDLGIPCNGPADCESWICSAAGKCAPDIVVLATALVDDFEDGNFTLPTNPAIEGRIGAWYPFSDMTGTITYDIANIGRGASKTGFTAKGKQFSSWGSGVGVDMALSKAPYDASQYTGLTFWARANLPEPAKPTDDPLPLTLTLALPDIDTAPSGGLCTTCDHHYNTPVQVLEKWQRYTIKFANLDLESGTVPAPTGFKANGLVSVQFRVAGGTDYELFLDDIAFVK